MPEVTPTPADVEAAGACFNDLVCSRAPVVARGPFNPATTIIARHIAAARAEEREACAKITDDWEPSAGDRKAMRYDPADAWVGIDMAREGISKAIRARNDA